MTPQLTAEMLKALAESPDQPLELIDPTTGESYSLVPTKAYKGQETVSSADSESQPSSVSHGAETETYTEIARRDPGILAKVLAMTVELFGGEATTYDTFDPEYPNDKYPVLSVTTKLSPREAVDAEHVWIHRLIEIAPDWRDVCLGIHFAE